MPRPCPTASPTTCTCTSPPRSSSASAAGTCCAGAPGGRGRAAAPRGEIASIPTWAFRGFTNTGPDDGILFTALGRDDTGGIIWGPSVLEEAAGHGLHLSAEGELIDTVAGGSIEGVPLTEPISEEQIAALRPYSVDEMRRRVATETDLDWSGDAFLGSRLPGGGAEFAPVIGYGLTEDRYQEPVIHNPHGFTVGRLRGRPEQGVPAHRHDATQVLMVESGEWEVTVNRGEPLTVRLGPWDMLSVPPGSWRSVRAVAGAADGGPANLVAVTGGDGRVRLEWDEQVVKAAVEAGRAIDHDGYLAPAALVPGAPGR
ncbi:cupin domain-containing protein [Nocardiopsis composta]